MLITFSGLDGAGKSTQIQRLEQWCERNNKKVVCLWARGGYTPGFEWLKKMLRLFLGRRLPPPGTSAVRLEKLARPRVARIWLGLAMVDLMLYWGIYLRYQRLRGRAVICDRYLDDTRLDFRRNFPAILFERSVLWRLLTWITPRPDASFLLWVQVAESLRRSREKGEPFPDDEPTLAWRLAAYMDETLFPDSRYMRLDCSLSVDTVAAKIVARVASLSTMAGRADAA